MALAWRTRKILGLVAENALQDQSNINPYDINNVEMEKHLEHASSDPVISITESQLEKRSDKIITEESRTMDVQCCKSLVPCYDSDMSEGKDVQIEEATTRTNERPSSSSSSSSNSSSSSSSSSSNSESESEDFQPNPQTNALSRPLTNIFIASSSTDETDDDDIIENTPPQQQQSRLHPRQARQIQNYQISPLYTDESEADMSDTDHTFVNNPPRLNRNYFFNRSSSESSSTSSTENRKRGRKRTKNPSKWKQNKIQRLRNSGKSYVSMSKSQKRIEARCLKEPCTNKCRLKCCDKISNDMRYEIFRQFWDLADLAKQRAYINSCMVDVQSKYKYTNAENPRRNNKAFYFLVNNSKIRVCKTFFKATLDVSDRMIFTIQNKVNENGFMADERRGKHGNHKKNDPQIIATIKEHINSIPRMESHYVRESTSKEYIEGGKNIKDLYNDFKLQQQNNNKDPSTYITYYKIFTTEFNIGFHQPKKDQCDLCITHTIGDSEENFIKHVEEKNLSRIEKSNDRKRVNKNYKVAVYDLEAVLQCPKGDISSFYYKSKLNCYNLTITELTNKECKVAYQNVHCYFWTECEAKRGATEVGSCVWNYLKSLSDEDDDQKEVIFYSDNCCGQNKNKYIASLYLYAVQKLNIKSITHKFLIRGHTHNEADSVHSLIEKEVKKNLKSGPIYSPDQYVTIIKNAKKSKPALKVHEMTYQSFYDMKALQEDYGYNFVTNTVGQTVNWNEIKILKMAKANSTTFLYKTSYKEENFKEVEVRNKRKKMIPTREISLKAAYEKKQELSTNKKKDLKDLMTKGVIPSFYEGFYNAIIS